MNAFSFVCCCTPTGTGTQGAPSETLHHVDASGEMNEIYEGQNQHMAGVLQNSAMPNFPAPVRTPRKDGAGEVSSQRGTNAGGPPNLSPREKEQEKVRLQEIVKDFSKAAVTGILVNIVDATTQEISPSVFTMDKYLYTLNLKPHSAPETEAQQFNMKDLSAIYKGPDVAAKAPGLEPMAACCMGIDMAETTQVFFHFKDQVERDKFYTCLKILRMSVDIYQQAR